MKTFIDLIFTLIILVVGIVVIFRLVDKTLPDLTLDAGRGTESIDAGPNLTEELDIITKEVKVVTEDATQCHTYYDEMFESWNSCNMQLFQCRNLLLNKSKK
jgi:hypothetical protein